MITQWTIRNFKSISDKVALDIAPLTIFTGANSSGKSTVIQSMLLAAQTLQNPMRSRSVVLNGHILRLGTFSDILSNNRRNEAISIGFHLRPSDEAGQGSSILVRNYEHLFHTMPREVESLNCSFSFSAAGPEDEREALQLQPRLEETLIILDTQADTRSVREEVHIRRSSKIVEQRVRELQLAGELPQRDELSSLEYEVLTPATPRYLARYYFGLPLTGKTAGASFLHFLPARISVVFDAVEEQARQLTELFLHTADYRYTGFRASMPPAVNEAFRNLILVTLADVLAQSDFPEARAERLRDTLEAMRSDFSVENYYRYLGSLPTVVRRKLEQRLAELEDELKDAIRGGRAPAYSLAYVPLSEPAEWAVEYVQRFFTRLVKYLGPLRDEPKPVYPLAGATDPKDIGFRGEHTAAVFELHKNTLIDYLPSELFRVGITEPRHSTVTLASAVMDWLRYMGVAGSLETVDQGKLGHELKVATTGTSELHDLTHVGVGVSQVLPILVLSLIAEKGSTLIFEQPELHLHPRVQTRLADFFLSMTMLNKQCVVETHSEYLVNRIRYQAAVSETERVTETTVIYFVENREGVSSFCPMRINEFGVIANWPKGFFDESEHTAAAILKAAMEKRRRNLASKSKQLTSQDA